jgi:hypothetical protein
MGRRWAKEHGIPVREFPADWKRLGKSAGRARNWEMARYAAGTIGSGETGGLIAITNGSGGTRHMIEAARLQGLKTWVKEVRL